jgi:AmpD protein
MDKKGCLILDQRGWLLESATLLHSPHYHQRTQPPSLLVVHGMSLPQGVFGGTYIHDLLMGQLDCSSTSPFYDLAGLRVSAHFLIDRQGLLFQFVATEQVAWHAGVSSFEGREQCNEFSLGVELEGVDDQGYTAQQYVTLALLTQCLVHRYPAITASRIVGHSAIAPGRKTDPGPGFDWRHFQACCQAEGVFACSASRVGDLSGL